MAPDTVASARQDNEMADADILVIHDFHGTLKCVRVTLTVIVAFNN